MVKHSKNKPDKANERNNKDITNERPNKDETTQSRNANEQRETIVETNRPAVPVPNESN